MVKTKRFIISIFMSFIMLLTLVPTGFSVNAANISASSDPITILYKCNQDSPSSNDIRFELQIKNNTTRSINLSDVMVRYFFTKDTLDTFTFNCDWAQINSSNVRGTFVGINPPESNADNYLEIKFSPSAGILAPNSNSGGIQIRFNETSYRFLTQTNDYSFNPNLKSFGENTKLSGYLNGDLVFGGGPIDNRTPRAVDDSATTDENTPVDIAILANDTDLDGSLNKSSVKITSSPSNGSVTINNNTGSVTYTPNADFFGVDQFKYTVADDKGLASNPATVKITVNKQLDPTDDKNKQRFFDLWKDLHDTNNGYFSDEGIPYHAAETLIIEATDYGHLSTSEAFSYYMWLESMYGSFTEDWSTFEEAWKVTEKYMIPSKEQQPTWFKYDPAKPATYAEEYELPNKYPSKLHFGQPVGQDPLSAELSATYGKDQVYGMHWLLDVDNWYGFGGNNTNPVFINTFQRGPEESTWETVPHPSIEKFEFGGRNGFLDLFTIDENYSKQWRYTEASDADARAVQATYWANKWAKEQGKSIKPLVDKASKMGDFMRGNFYDKYFRPMGSQSPTASGTGSDSAAYLLNWYYAWGGGLGEYGNWAWKIGCSHNMFGYQNPMTAYIMSQDEDFEPKSPNGKSDWDKSLTRQLEFLTWLQSSTGAIAGGATNSWNGRYEQYPAGTPTFYGMAYKEAPVYLDPPDSRWFGMQTWCMQRVAELYYETNNQMAKELLDRWVTWVKTVVDLNADGTFAVPANLKWSGKPDTWTGRRTANTGLTCTVETKNQDLGVVGSLCNTLTYYAAASGDDEAKDLASELLERMWTLYKDEKGLGAPTVADQYHRIFEQEVHVPSGFNGTMPNGDQIKPGIKFIDIRSNYKNDPDWKRVEDAYKNGEQPVFYYHRFWSQAECAVAYGTFAKLFPNDDPTGNKPPKAVNDSDTTNQDTAVTTDILANDSDKDGTIDATSVKITTNPANGSVSINSSNGKVTYTPAPGFFGTDTYKYTVADNEGAVSNIATVTITVKKVIDDLYESRFMELWEDLHDKSNGYFSDEGIPYHASETLIIEATDYGHLSTSEAFSYYMWLESLYGKFTGDWSTLQEAWDVTEKYMIPSKEQQPTWFKYDPDKPATYAEEYELPNKYPSKLHFGQPVGQDPLSAELSATYGKDQVYGMHWLLDVDNWYGFGGNNTNPVFINTFQRGPEESTWETVPHPSIEKFEFGGRNGFLDLFTIDENYSKQWRYTEASDADARAVQAMYWANKWAKEQGQSVDPLVDKASKMGDFLRGNFYDKYFRPMGSQSPTASGTGSDSAAYLLNWYYAWGGGLGETGNWAWKIGCSHNMFGYQNPMTAYIMSQDEDFEPKSSNGKSDWNKSLTRQLEFLTWLQSSTGAIAGGATNSWNGRYEKYPDGTPTFYGMAYKEAPVYLDPPDSRWFGMQTWCMQRVAELYYETDNQMAKELLDRWVAWVKTVVDLNADGTFAIPANLKWSGKPDTWTGKRTANAGLTCTVDTKNQDLGVVGSLCNTLAYYAKASGDEEARLLAKELLDRMWTLYRDEKGLGAPTIADQYNRIFEQEVYVPSGFQGTMPNGDQIKPGIKFIDIRSKYKDDPDWQKVVDAYEAGEYPEFYYHRFWSQADCAIAYGTYSILFDDVVIPDEPPVANNDTASTTSNSPVVIDILANDTDINNNIDKSTVTITTPPTHGTLTVNRLTGAVNYVPDLDFYGTDSFTYTVADDEGAISNEATVTITVIEESTNQPPVAVNDTASTQQEQSVIIAILANDTDSDGSIVPSSVKIVANPSNGSIIVNSITGKVTYTPAIGFYGTDSFKYTVKDNDDAISNEATVTISVSEKPNDYAYSVEFEVINDWISGFTGKIIITNTGNLPIRNWSLKFDFDKNISSFWTAKIISNIGDQYVISCYDWNNTIEPGSSIILGLSGSPGNVTTEPTNFNLDYFGE